MYSNPTRYTDAEGLQVATGTLPLPSSPTIPGFAGPALGLAGAGYAGWQVGSAIYDKYATEIQDGIEYIVESCSDGDKPSKADCSKAKKLLKNVIRLAEKNGRKLPENRKNELRNKINSKTITSNDLPGSIQAEFPASLRGKTLAEIEALCG